MNIINNVHSSCVLWSFQSPWGFRHQGNTLSAHADSKAGRNIVRREFKCRGLKTELARQRSGKRQSQSIFRLFFAATVEGRHIFFRPRFHYDAMMVRARLIPCVTERALFLASINNAATVIQSHLQSIKGAILNAVSLNAEVWAGQSAATDRDPEETIISIFRALHQYKGVICRHYSFAATVDFGLIC